MTDHRSREPAELPDHELANALRLYAADIESEGRQRAPLFLREAARRLDRVALHCSRGCTESDPPRDPKTPPK